MKDRRKKSDAADYGALVIYMVLVIPMGTYLYHITTGRKTFADPVFEQDR